MSLMRFLTSDDLRPGQQLAPLGNEPELRYHNMLEAQDPLANRADARGTGETLLVNYYRIIADHFRQEILAGFDLSRLPSIDYNEVSRAVWYRLLYGYGILCYLSGSLRAISPRYWWPVIDNGLANGDIMVVPYASKSTLGGNAGIANMPDHALLCQLSRQGTGQLFRSGYTGITIGMTWEPIGRVTRFTLAGDGYCDFDAIRPVVDALDAVLKAGVRIIDRYSQPHIQVPASVVQYDDDGNPSLKLNKQGNVFPLNRDDKDVSYVSLQANDQLYQYIMQTLLSLLGSVAKIPPSAFNLFPLARMESGVAIEALAQASNEKAKVMQDEFARAFDNLGLNIERIEHDPASTSGDASTDQSSDGSSDSDDDAGGGNRNR